MKFARKLAVALWVGICLVYGVNAFDRFRRELALFEGDMRRDHTVMGRGLGAAVAEVWEDEGRERALDLVERANQRESQILIRWVDLAAPEGDPRRATAPAASLPGVAGGDAAFWVDRAGEGRQYSYVPLLVDGRWSGAIELSESLAAQRAYLRASLVRMGLTSGSLALMAGGVAMGLGVVFVGRPIRQLVEKARRVGSGDFGGELELRQEDELGELAREMNAMSARLAEARARLDAEMAARIAAIDQLRHGERLMTVGKLASGVAHELGTPLNVITQRARMVASGEVAGSEVPDNARVIAEQSERITRIVRDLLDFARRRAPETARHDVRAIVERAVALLTPLARRHGVRFDLDAPLFAMTADVDVVQIQQVLTNLLINGVQAMPEGGTLRVLLFAETAMPPADVGTEMQRWIRVVVDDEGAGIAPENLARVFDPFFTTKQVGVGTGLGLSVAWGIVREHGGWIGVQSPPGTGARFSVYLPEVSP